MTTETRKHIKVSDEAQAQAIRDEVAERDAFAAKKFGVGSKVTTSTAVAPVAIKLSHAEFAVKAIKALATEKYPGVHSSWGSTGNDGKKRPSFNALFGAYFGLDQSKTIEAINKLVDDKVITKFPVRGGYLLHIYDSNYGKGVRQVDAKRIDDTLAKILS